jgi:hypothetical protein
MPISPTNTKSSAPSTSVVNTISKLKQVKDDLVLYDSKDLVTHGVVLGMTGSGKTGLCLALLEEAAIDGVPVIAIDPKGDLGNALLTFPNLTPRSSARGSMRTRRVAKISRPTTTLPPNPRCGKKASATGARAPSRIQKLRETVDMAIYTPGSNAGLPVSILSSLNCPPAEVMDDAEALADRIESTVSSMLGLMDIEADPIQSPEHILLSNIVAHCWKKGQNISLENLVRHIQQPPIRKIGVVDLESFMPEAKRTPSGDEAEQPARLPRLQHLAGGRAARHPAHVLHEGGQAARHHLLHRASERHRAHVLRLAAAQSTPRLDAHAAGHHLVARHVLHG